MNVQEAKEKLKKDGYTSFQLEDFDKDFYNFLLPVKCNEESNIKDKCNILRANVKHNDEQDIIDLISGLTGSNQFATYNDAKECGDKLLEKIGDGIMMSQIWYYTDMNRIIAPDQRMKGTTWIIDSKNANTNLQNYIRNIVTYFFGFEETQEYSLFAPCFTYYDKGCLLRNHSDGTGTGRICALLIYLNETYDENDGGILVLDDYEKVIPTFGNVAIIDLQSFDIPHMVTKVTGGIGRYAFLTFVKLKENEFVDY
jgi:hypothetical protein